MHAERVRSLLDYIKNLPDERFVYWCHKHISQPDCGCVAYHAYKLFDLTDFTSWYLSRHLSINQREAWILCIVNSGGANKADAVLRLEHLLEHGSLETYDFSNESWQRKNTDASEPADRRTEGVLESD